MSKLARLIYAIVGMVVVAGLVAAVSTVAQPESTTPPKKGIVAHIYTIDELLAEANRLRAEKGVAPLVIDERLNQSAQWKADDMKAFDYYGHAKLGETGTNGTQKAIDLTAMDCVQVSENLDGATIYESPFDGWANSKPHYEAEINPRYETTGFGMVETDTEILYVQHFCDLR